MSKYPDSNTPNRSWKENPLCIKKKLKVKKNFKRIKRTHDISFPCNRHNGIHKTMTIKEMSMDGEVN